MEYQVRKVCFSVRDLPQKFSLSVSPIAFLVRKVCVLLTDLPHQGMDRRV